MNFPVTAVHSADHYANRCRPGGVYDWREPQAPDLSDVHRFSAREFHGCGYCGSMHPVELAAAIRAGATVHWADRKYGWPHKVYVEGAPNPYAGQLEIRRVTWCSQPPQAEIDAGKWERYQDGYNSTTGKQRFSYRILGPKEPAAATAHGKFYTLHLQDATPEDRAVIESAMGLTFQFHGDGKVGWEPAP
jgi:hypothetical protein